MRVFTIYHPAPPEAKIPWRIEHCFPEQGIKIVSVFVVLRHEKGMFSLLRPSVQDLRTGLSQSVHDGDTGELLDDVPF